MSKRKSLTFDSNQLAEDLKESTGKGVDAFFSSPSQSPNRDIQRPHSPKPPAKKKMIAISHTEEVKPITNASTLASKQACEQACLLS